MEDNLQLIQLSKLAISAANVRKTDSAAGLDELVASIAAHGLLQNLTVRPVLRTNGKSSGKFEVVAGSRRFEALKRLVDEKRLPKTYAVPCRVIEEGSAVEISLAENVARAPLHPADQFAAFAALHADGCGAEEIASRFGVNPRLVEQRLKLNAVSPRLIALYREGGMTLEQLMAFTVSDDHEAQERVWFDSPLHGREPHSIRRGLTRSLVEGRDRRARFVGVDAYEAAGGTVVRDLFRSDDEGYFADGELLDRLVGDKLESAARSIREEGWAWVEVCLEMDYTRLARLGRVSPVPVPLSDESQAKLASLAARYDALIDEHGESPPENVEEELERLSAEIDELSAGQSVWAEEDKARAGVLIALDYEGGLRIERGLLKPQDRKDEKRAKTADTPDGAAAAREAKTVLPETLIADLTAHRTAALRATLSEAPDVALTALLYALTLRLFYDPGRDTCIDIRPVIVDLGPLAPGIGESKAAEAFARCHATWVSRLPKEEDGLWSWLEGRGMEVKLSLLAYCIAQAVNAVDRRRFPNEDRDRIAQADLIAEALALDMRAWWQPTKERCLGRFSKAQIMAAVADGVAPEAAKAIADLKKEAMVARAEQILAETSWVPVPLRVSRVAERPVDDTV